LTITLVSMRTALALAAAAAAVMLAGTAGCAPLGSEHEEDVSTAASEDREAASGAELGTERHGQAREPYQPVDLGSLEGSACERLAELTALLAGRADEPVPLLRRLGREAAGIGPPASALRHLLRDGADRIVGGGFAPRLEDGTGGQARHFAAVAVTVTYAGPETTRLLAERLRDDPPDSPDGRLTDEAIAFADGLLARTIDVSEAGRWIRGRVCAGGEG
jgi:hypothetical protein